ncbi:MAG: hypothetical protein ACOYMA_13345 [Bacteroidia bacterium]
MSRSARKKGFEIMIANKGGIFELIDAFLMAKFVLRKAECDFVIAGLTMEEAELLSRPEYTITQAKEVLQIIDRLVDEFYRNSQEIKLPS